MSPTMTGPPTTTIIVREKKWRHAQQLENAIRVELKRKDPGPSHDNIESLLPEFRSAAIDVLFHDFEYATEQGIENHIWDITIVLRKRYKKLMERFEAEGARVQKRKWEQHYVDFLKKSQHFYKGYIQRLASHFGGLKDLRRIAHCLTLETLRADNPVAVSEHVEKLVEASCQSTMLHLGDLSRYRNELRVNKPKYNWDAAMGFYGLARDLDPDDGYTHNQMAVVALADQNHLDALYHLYRAIAIKKPHSLARGNLEIEFKKITSIWDKKEKPLVPHAKTDSEAALILWFVRLHAKFYEGVEFATHDELENEVLSRLALLLKEQTFDVTLGRIVIINIAAEYVAGERVKEQKGNTEANKQSYFFFLRFNLRVLFVLLQILQPEIDDPVPGDDLPNESLSAKPREVITAVARRILPALRQYSTWLVSQYYIIAATTDEGPLNLHIKQMWTMYADVLTQIVSTFPVNELPQVDYLLDEDETTVGFKPLREPENMVAADNVYVTEDGALKPRLTDAGVFQNHPNVEMLARVKHILCCALRLHCIEGSPIKLSSDPTRFNFVEEGLSFDSPATFHEPRSRATVSRNGKEPANRRASPEITTGQPYQQASDHISAQPNRSARVNLAPHPHRSMETDMNRMVNNLLDSSAEYQDSSFNETSYGMHTGTANDVFAQGTGGFQGSYPNPMQATPTSAIHPGIWSSPFTPQPNELPPISPERSATARQLSPLSLNYNLEQRRATGAAANRSGGPQVGKSAWGDGSSGQFMPRIEPLEWTLKKSTTQYLQSPGIPSSRQEPRSEFPNVSGLSLQSSNFADDSSIYGNASDIRKTAASRSRGPQLATGMFMGNNTTYYPGGTDFDKMAMLQSSLYNGFQPAGRAQYISTPPGGQGG